MESSAKTALERGSTQRIAAIGHMDRSTHVTRLTFGLSLVSYIALCHAIGLSISL